MTQGRVLLVDDLQDWRITLSGLLKGGGYDVQVASTLTEALSLLKQDFFHVAILDIRLDETDENNKDGLLLMHQINRKSPMTSIIILTGFADVKMVREALQPNSNGVSPAFGFLEKSEIELLPGYVEQAYLNALTKNVKDLIAQGENEKVEFKSSIRWDFQRGNVNKNLQIVIAKTIAGMLNQKGGVLLIGLDDTGKILGIEPDLKTLRKPNIDEFQLAIIDIVRSCLGVTYMEYIHVNFEEVDKMFICLVAVDSSPEPVYLISGDEHQFWVRIGNSTQRLDVKEATGYIISHWGRGR
jgi:CheY-like chemotaxis protein